MNNNTPTLYLNGASAVIRHLLTMASGWLMTRSWLTPEQGTQFIEIGAGALVFLGTVGWSLWQKHASKKQLVVALAEADMSEKEVTARIASDKPMPTVLSPPTVVPVVPITKP